MSDMDTDPAYRAGWNDALEWAANWIVTYSDGHSHEARQYAKDTADSFRASRKPIEQQSFFDAVRNDPYMTPERKEHWLKFEKKEEER